jgi:predicted nucleotidyltransferase component of viral defense system
LTPQGLSHSVQVRLVRHAKVLGVDAQLILTRYATERLLYRLSCSPYAGRFVLKGALLLIVWLGEAIRPTRDADLLGVGDLAGEALADVFREICEAEVPPDGLVFDGESIRVAPIRREDAYGGYRVTLRTTLGLARLRVQVDVGFGDAVTPEPEWLEYPTLLDMPRPRLQAYPVEAVVAEKVHAMILLGSKNSRMRDFFDIHALAQKCPFDGSRLSHALRATFTRRRTVIPVDAPIAITPAFAQVEGKRAQWDGFVRRNRLQEVSPGLEIVIKELAAFIGPVLSNASRCQILAATWPPGGPWQF